MPERVPQPHAVRLFSVHKGDLGSIFSNEQQCRTVVRFRMLPRHIKRPQGIADPVHQQSRDDGKTESAPDEITGNFYFHSADDGFLYA